MCFSCFIQPCFSVFFLLHSALLWLIADCLYSTVPHSQAGSLRSHLILHGWLAFYSVYLNIHQSGVLTVLARLVPHETAAILARSVYTIQPCCFMQSHICKVYACLTVTCHLRFWQNDQDHLTCYCGLCFELVWKNFECVICPEVIWPCAVKLSRC